MTWQLKRAEEEYAEEVGRMEEAMEELTARVCAIRMIPRPSDGGVQLIMLSTACMCDRLMRATMRSRC